MRVVQFSSRALLLLLTALLAQAAWAADNQAYTVKLPADAAATRAIPSIGNAVALPGSYGQWGFAKATVEPEVPAGSVALKVRYFADPDCTALTLLYVEDSAGDVLPIYGLRIAAGSDKAVHEASFSVNSPKGVRAIVIKRGDAGDVPTVPILSIELTYQPPMPDPRVRAYKELLARPAPAGLDRAIARTWIQEADAAALAMDSKRSGELYGKVEGWLAAESHLAWLDDTVEYLFAAATVLKRSVKEAETLRASLQQARLSLNKGETEAAKTGLDKVETGINPLDRAIGGGTSVLPQKQPVIATWNKNWTLAGFAEEPTPLAVKWPGGVTLSLTDKAIPDTIVFGGASVKSRAEYAKDFTVRRSWTGNVWEGPGFKFTASVLTPLVLIDGIARRLSFVVTGLGNETVTIYKQRSGTSVTSIGGEEVQRVSSEEALAIAGDNGGVLVIPSGAALAVSRSGEGVRVSCDGGGLAIVSLPTSWTSDDSKNSDAARRAAVSFWSSVAAAPPVQCVQTYDGKKLALRYVYESRPHPTSVKPVRIAPVPPLTMVAQESGWNTGFRSRGFVGAKWRDDAFRWVEGDTVAFNMPPMKGSGLRGINIGIAAADEKVYQELAKLGATSIRMLVKEDEVDTKLAQHLAWCKEAGLRVNVDQHYGAYYAPTPEDQAKLIALWEKIVRVCQPSRDVVRAYDLKNEPMENAAVYLPWAQKCIEAIRKIDPVTPILVEAPDMANPGGFSAFTPFQDKNIVYGAHMYWPHGFTHGRGLGTKLFGSPEASPARFYPGWITPMDWANNSETWFNGGFEWWDRWAIAATCLPVTEFIIRHRLPVDVGEFGVSGYIVRDVTIPTSQMWLRDSIDLFETWGASWDVWSYEHGFTWYPGGKEVVAEKWRELNRR